MLQNAKIIIIIDNFLCCFQKVCTNLYYLCYCLDCFVPRNDDMCRRHCEERSNPDNHYLLFV